MLIGIVGKPSCGKSTFFKAATLADVAIASYPFTTIKPNRGVGFVRVQCVDKEFGVQCNPRSGFCLGGTRFAPVDLIDVAGLVPGAHEGKGLGNQFLNDLNQADVLIHIIDCAGATNEKGESVPAGSYDPANDVRFLEDELDLWYLDIIKRHWEKISRLVEQTKIKVEEQIEKQLSAFKVTLLMIEEVLAELKVNKEKPGVWKEEELKALAVSLRRKTKPIIIACNKMDLPEAEKNFSRLQKEFPNYKFVPCAADSEVALRSAAKAGLIKYSPGDSDFQIVNEEKINSQQRTALNFIRENVMKKFSSTGVQQCLDAAVFDFLKFIAIFPGGVGKLSDSQGRVLPDCFLMPPGSTALDFAFKIHTDFGKNFLYAVDVRRKMKISGEQKLKNRDVVEIISAAK